MEYGARIRAVTVNLSTGGADAGEAGEGDEIRQVEGTAVADTILVFGLDRKGDTIDARGGDDDFVSVRDGEADSVDRGQGTDTINADVGANGVSDVRFGCERVKSVGVLGLSPRTLQERAGRVADVEAADRDGHRQLERRPEDQATRLSSQEA